MERFIKKTLVERLERPDGGKPIDILIGNDDMPIRLLKVDNNNEPILTDMESATLDNEAREFKSDNPIERHQMAVEKEKNGNGNNNNDEPKEDNS